VKAVRRRQRAEAEVSTTLAHVLACICVSACSTHGVGSSGALDCV
jgi:hypothetical protein